MTTDDERFDAWVDGGLDPAELAAWQARLAQSPDLAAEARLQERLDGFLKARFTPPERPLADLSSLLEQASASAPRPPSLLAASPSPAEPAGRRAAGFAPLLLAAAAVVLVCLRLTSPSGDDRPVASVELASVLPGELEPFPLFARSVHEACERGLERPDLERVYADALRRDELVMGCSDPAEAGRSDIETFLAGRFDERLEILPSVTDVIEGPLSSKAWPTGVVLAAYPDGPQGAPSVVVADAASYHRCCLHIEARPGSRLNTFTWSRGKLFLVEISSQDEPRMLQYFAEP